MLVSLLNRYDPKKKKTEENKGLRSRAEHFWSPWQQVGVHAVVSLPQLSSRRLVHQNHWASQNWVPRWQFWDTLSLARKTVGSRIRSGGLSRPSHPLLSPVPILPPGGRGGGSFFRLCTNKLRASWGWSFGGLDWRVRVVAESPWTLLWQSGCDRSLLVQCWLPWQAPWTRGWEARG